MALTLDDVKTMLGLFQDSDYGEMRLRVGALSIVARKDGAVPRGADRADAIGSAPSPAQADTPAVSDGAGILAIRASISGTFYRAPSPGAEPFCKAGDRVQPDTTLGLIEVMKLFTSVPAGVAGTVVQIVPENGVLVEAGQPLVLIRAEETGS